MSRVAQQAGFTQKQATVLAFILRYHEREGYAPTIREITDGCGLSSTSVAMYALNALANAGHIRLGDRKSRAIDVRPALAQRREQASH